MKVALVHDYLNEFGGAERVLMALAEMYPQAPIYTAFYRPDSPAHRRFKSRQLITSWAHRIPGFSSKLHSPLRFLAPLIWESFDFTGFDLVISSASWYITKGILTRPETLHVSYIHTPPRYLYGYETSVNWQKYAPIRLYAKIVNKYLRRYDFAAAQRPDVLVANSQNVRRRIKKYYHRDATVIYPPVELPIISSKKSFSKAPTSPQENHGPKIKSQGGEEMSEERILALNMKSNAESPEKNSLRDNHGYFLIVSRLVGGKGLEIAVQACSELNLSLKVVGQPSGWSRQSRRLKKLAGKNIEFIGQVSDQKLAHFYAGAQAFLAVARDEDFGITPVEAMLAGTPVIAYRGGGYLETVIEGKTGIFFDQYSVAGLKDAINSFILHPSSFSPAQLTRHAQKFSKQRFIKEIKSLISKEINKSLL